jgi:hypothetical protein
MHDSAFTTIDPSLNRMALGFFQVNRNGHRIIGHEGDTIWFHSALHLYLDDNVGLFLSMNSIGRDAAARAIRTGLMDGFADRYFPSHAAAAATAVSPSVAIADAAKIVGQYSSSQQEPGSYLSLLELFTQNTVTADRSGNIFVSSLVRPNGEEERFVEVAPLVWLGADSKERLVAKTSPGSISAWAASESSPDTVFLRTSGSRNAAWLLPMLAGSIGALIFATFLWPTGALIRRHYGLSPRGRSMNGQVRLWLQNGIAAASLLMIAWLVTVGTMVSTFTVTSALDPWILVLHFLSILVFPLVSGISLMNAWVTLKERPGLHNAMSKVWSIVLVVSCLTLLWVAIVFHLIGLNVAF